MRDLALTADTTRRACHPSRCRCSSLNCRRHRRPHRRQTASRWGTIQSPPSAFLCPSENSVESYCRPKCFKPAHLENDLSDIGQKATQWTNTRACPKREALIQASGHAQHDGFRRYRTPDLSNFRPRRLARLNRLLKEPKLPRNRVRGLAFLSVEGWRTNGDDIDLYNIHRRGSARLLSFWAAWIVADCPSVRPFIQQDTPQSGSAGDATEECNDMPKSRAKKRKTAPMNWPLKRLGWLQLLRYRQLLRAQPVSPCRGVQESGAPVYHAIFARCSWAHFRLAYSIYLEYDSVWLRAYVRLAT